MADFYHYTYLNANGYLRKFQIALGMPELNRAELTKYLQIFNKKYNLYRFIVKDDKGNNALYYKDTLNAILGVDRTGYEVTKPKHNLYLKWLNDIIDDEQRKEIEKEFPQEYEPEDYTPEDSNMNKVSDKLIYNDNYGEVMESLNESNYDVYYHCTTLEGLAGMIDSNSIKLSNSNGMEQSYRGKQNFYYLSLTRSKSIAQGYVQHKWANLKNGGSGLVRLTLDGRALNNMRGVRIQPMDYMFNMMKYNQGQYDPTLFKRYQDSRDIKIQQPTSGPQLYGRTDISYGDMYNYEKNKLQRQPFAQTEESLTFSNPNIDHIENFDRIVRRIDILLRGNNINTNGQIDIKQQWQIIQSAITELFGNRWADNSNKITYFGDITFIYFDNSSFEMQKNGMNLHQFIMKYITRNGTSCTYGANINTNKYNLPQMPANFGGEGNINQQQVMENKKRTIIITESQLNYIKSKLDEGISITKYSVEPDKVKIVKKYLDDNFIKGGISQMGEDGYPMTLPIVAIKGTDGKAARNMSDKQLFALLLDKFGKVYSDGSQCKKFLQQVMKDWYYDKISKDGLLSINLY